MSLLSRLASTKLTLVGMITLAVGAGLSYDNPVDTPVWVLVVPLGVLALNLLAAIVTVQAINRRPGLLFFHLGLLGICLLAALGRMTFYEARLELSRGGLFSPSVVHEQRQGPWHKGSLERIRFVQGPYTVSYNPGLIRGPTRNYLLVANKKEGWDEYVIGDDRPLIVDGYRFYTSFNKGFAVVLTWTPDGGTPATGTVHMPSYPLFEYRQDNRWTPPGGDEIKFWLRLETAFDPEAAWVLDEQQSRGTLVVNSDGKRVELSPGEEIALQGGRLRYEQLSSWMGYKIFYDPTLHWLFMSAMLAVLGLAYHYWQKFADQPLAGIKESSATEESKRVTQKPLNQKPLKQIGAKVVDTL